MAKAALMNQEVQKGRPLDEAESQQVMTSLIKQRRDSIEQFRKGGRDDLADKEAAEIVDARDLPAGAARCGRARAHRRTRPSPSSAPRGPKDLGRVMKAVMPKLAGQAVDGKTITEMVRRRLG